MAMDLKGSTSINYSQCIGGDGDVVCIDDLDEVFLYEDVESADGDVELGEKTGSCCEEVKSCSSLVKRHLQSEWTDMNNTFVRLNFKKCCQELFSMETLKRRLPILTWAPKYRLTELQGDLIAGFTIGLTVLPQSIAYAAIAGVPAQYGLYSSFIGSFVYVVFGSSKDMCLGPSAIASLLTGIYATSPIAEDLTFTLMLTFFSGVIEVAMFLFGLGFLIDFISLPVIKAFTSACAITIAMSQVKKWWGLQNVPKDFLSQLADTLRKLPQTRLWDFLLGVSCIFIIIILKKLKEKKWNQRFKELPLHYKILQKVLWVLGTGRNVIAIILATFTSYLLLQNGLQPFSLTGYIPPGIPSFAPPPFSVTDPKTNRTYTASDISQSIGLGYIIVPIIGLVEAMSIGSVFARRFNYRIDPNQELLAFGIGNILTSFVSGYTITGTFSRTALNAQSGVKTPAGGIVTGLIVLLSLQFLTPLFKYIPDASLAVVVILAVLDMVTFHKVWIFWKTRKIEIIPWMVTFILSLVLNIAYGVIIGAGISVILLLHPLSRPKIKIIEKEAGAFFDCGHVNEKSKIVLVEFNTGLMYPAIEYLKNKVLPLYSGDNLPRGVILDLHHVSVADSTTVQGIRVLLENFNKQGIVLILCNLQKPVDSILMRSRLKFFQKASSVREAVKKICDITPCTVASMFSCKAEYVLCRMIGEEDQKKNLNAAVADDDDDDDDHRRIVSSAAGIKSILQQAIERQQREETSPASNINPAFTEDELNKKFDES